MIHTRKTIFKTLKYKIRELTKHGQLSSLDFKRIMLAVILNDLKEWSEYIPKDKPDAIVNLLNNFLLNKCFKIERIAVNESAYINVNTPQTNSTWRRVWDDPTYLFSTPQKHESGEIVCEPWEIDSEYNAKIIYFYSVNQEGEPVSNIEYLQGTYGIYGEKLKTVHLKMDIYIDRETGNAWYLDNADCTWKPVGGKTNMTEEDVERIINDRKITHSKTELNAIHADLTTDEEIQDILLATSEDIEV